MGRRSTIPKNRVIVECTDANRRVKAVIIKKTETNIKVMLPTGFIMTLEKRRQTGVYLYYTGGLESVSDGHPVA